MKKCLWLLSLLFLTGCPSKEDQLGYLAHHCRVVSFSVGFENPTCALVCFETSAYKPDSMLPVSCSWKNQVLKIEQGSAIGGVIPQ